MLWDIFCRVIDNLGDIGVCWRLCADLASRGHRARLWVDDAQALRWMAPGALEGCWPGVELHDWESASEASRLRQLPLADAWVEAFGCELPEPFVAHFAQVVKDGGHGAAMPPPEWLNLEYLSAEPYVERCHALPSPVLRGPAQGWTKTFFYPGFTPRTGGLLREPSVPQRWQAPDHAAREAFFRQCGLAWQGERTMALFCYEPPLLGALLEHLAGGEEPVSLLITPGRAATAVQALPGALMPRGNLRLHFLPPLSQADFDHLLRCCDVNFVRGEDSVVRAIWAGRPFVWHIYQQDDQAHAAKLEAFMDRLALPTDVRTLHRAWNGLLTIEDGAAALQALWPHGLDAWQAGVQAARARLLEMEDLTSQLVQFVRNKR